MGTKAAVLTSGPIGFTDSSGRQLSIPGSAIHFDDGAVKADQWPLYVANKAIIDAWLPYLAKGGVILPLFFLPPQLLPHRQRAVLRWLSPLLARSPSAVALIPRVRFLPPQPLPRIGVNCLRSFQVKCDGTTTTQQDIDNGIVNIIVAFAPLKPAEFVIIKIAQLAGQVQA